jgi:formiminoglutamase
MINDDIRLGDIIVENDSGDVVLIGFPYDEGVRRNNGRVGAKFGPKSFRDLLKRTGTVVNAEYDDLDLRKYLKISDGGNINEDLTLEEAHQQLEKRIDQLISKEKIPFVVGGGNDQSYPNVSALLNHSKSIVVINIDAHLDVRPLKENNKAHSGSPFRLLCEDQRFYQNPSNRFIEFASQGSQCSIEHVNYLRSKSSLTQIIWYQSIRDDPLTPFRSLIKLAEEQKSDIFVSFDIDSIISSSCPGVSAPATVGLTAQQACDIAFYSGQSFQVKLMDLSEYNPLIEEYRTGKLVTQIFYHFILGRAKAIRDSMQ